MAKTDTPYRRVRRLPKRFKPLKTYDDECKRGLAHTAEYDQQMAALKDQFHRWLTSE